MTKSYAWKMAATLLTAVLLAGCPPKDNEVVEPGPDAGPLQLRLHQIDVVYEILLKDNPTTNDTYEFRQWLTQAQKDLEQGKTRDADALILQSENWIKNARIKFYNDHETAVMSGRSPETAAQLMESANTFVTIARQKQAENNAWAAEQYFQAGIEQCELALIAAQRSPEQALELIKLAQQMEQIYQAAGMPDRAAQSRERVIGALVRIVADLDKSIRNCLKEKSPACSRDILLEKEDNYKNQIKEMQKNNDLRNKIAIAGENYAPGQFHPFDHTVHIQNFQMRWLSHWRPESTPPPPNEDLLPTIDLDQEKQMKAELAAHDRLKQGAVPAAGEGVNIAETAITVQGSAVVIRGTLTNVRTSPILNPRITVVGGQLMSEIIDLGYPRMEPLISTSFQIPIQHFSPDALYLAGQKLPSHEILLIFDDAEGKEIKVIQKIR